jgi:hypothetical protein
VAKSHFNRKKDTFDEERRELIAHILECDVCLAVVADCRAPIKECADRCPTYRKLLERMESGRAQGKCTNASGVIP